MARYYGIQEQHGHTQHGHLTIRCPLADKNDTDEHDTGYDLKAGDIVKNAYVQVFTAEATASTKTIDVGLLAAESGGDADGFLDGVSTAATGMVQGTLISSGQTRGALLRVDESGGGVLVPSQAVIAAATSIAYTLGEAATELDADIIIEFYRPASA
jgi:hypothetical protein